MLRSKLGKLRIKFSTPLLVWPFRIIAMRMRIQLYDGCMIMSVASSPLIKKSGLQERDVTVRLPPEATDINNAPPE